MLGGSAGYLTPLYQGAWSILQHAWEEKGHLGSVHTIPTPRTRSQLEKRRLVGHNGRVSEWWVEEGVALRGVGAWQNGIEGSGPRVPRLIISSVQLAKARPNQFNMTSRGDEPRAVGRQFSAEA